jgi:hypothetical protein
MIYHIDVVIQQTHMCVYFLPFLRDMHFACRKVLELTTLNMLGEGYACKSFTSLVCRLSCFLFVTNIEIFLGTPFSVHVLPVE